MTLYRYLNRYSTTEKRLDMSKTQKVLETVKIGILSELRTQRNFKPNKSTNKEQETRR